MLYAMKKEVYLDYASTTPVDPRVLAEMVPYFSDEYGNPESRHQKGKKAKIAIDQAREIIAKILNCRESEIIFCGSATEANNLAIFGIIGSKPAHFITTKIEHPSVLEPFKELERRGHKVTWLNVDQEGFISLKELEKSIQTDTKLVSIIYANNEIGTIQEIEKIAEICKNHSVPFHTDACQAAGSESLNTTNIDLMTLNASKIYGPKGIGVLYCRRKIKLSPLILGGGQEHGLRSGTHNVPGIVGFAHALELAHKEPLKTALRDKLIEELLKIPNTKLNGPSTKRLPNNINITFEGIASSDLLLHLDNAGIYCSSGSSCGEGDEKASHVLLAIGLSEKQAKSSIRITLGKPTTEEEINYTIETLKTLTSKLWQMS